VTSDFQDHRGLLVRKEQKERLEREASKVIQDLQAHKEELVKKVTWAKEVNQVAKE